MSGESVSQASSAAPVLSVRDLVVEVVDRRRSRASPVDGVSFDVGANEVLGIVGESGSGKSITMLAVMGLLTGATRLVGAAKSGCAGAT